MWGSFGYLPADPPAEAISHREWKRLVDLARWFVAARMENNSPGLKVPLLSLPDLHLYLLTWYPLSACTLPSSANSRCIPRKLSACVFPMNATVSVTNNHPMQPSFEPVGISSRGLATHVLPGIFSKKLELGVGSGDIILQSYHLDSRLCPAYVSSKMPLWAPLGFSIFKFLNPFLL